MPDGFDERLALGLRAGGGGFLGFVVSELGAVEEEVPAAVRGGMRHKGSALRAALLETRPIVHRFLKSVLTCPRLSMYPECVAAATTPSPLSRISPAIAVIWYASRWIAAL